MGMDVLASRNRLHGFADWPAIFDHGPVLRQIAHGYFVAERNFISQLDAADLFSFERDCAHVRAFFEISHGYADIVLGFVQKNTMLHSLMLNTNFSFGRWVKRCGQSWQQFSCGVVGRARARSPQRA